MAGEAPLRWRYRARAAGLSGRRRPARRQTSAASTESGSAESGRRCARSQEAKSGAAWAVVMGRSFWVVAVAAVVVAVAAEGGAGPVRSPQGREWPPDREASAG